MIPKTTIAKRAVKKYAAFAIFAALLVFSLSAVLPHSSHTSHIHDTHGPGGSCAVCAQAASAASVLKHISATGVVALFVLGGIFTVPPSSRRGLLFQNLKSPIALRIRLNY